jgi:hypothetical protein
VAQRFGQGLARGADFHGIGQSGVPADLVRPQGPSHAAVHAVRPNEEAGAQQAVFRGCHLALGRGTFQGAAKQLDGSRVAGPLQQERVKAFAPHQDKGSGCPAGAQQPVLVIQMVVRGPGRYSLFQVWFTDGGDMFQCQKGFEGQQAAAELGPGKAGSVQQAHAHAGARQRQRGRASAGPGPHDQDVKGFSVIGML